MESIRNILLNFSELDYLIFIINLSLLIFSRPIISGFRRNKDASISSSKLFALRSINIVLIVLYISALFIADITKQISQTGLTFLLAFLIVHFLQMLILRKFGREKEIDDVKYRTETYQSEVFSLIIVLIAMVTVVVLIINIWGMTDWLKTTSVLGILAIIIFSTKDVWAPDNINGLILLYHGDIEPGAVVRVDELELLAITIQTTLTQTIFRDLRSKHLIVVPNARLRACKLEILSKSPASGLVWYIDYKISYGLSSAQVEAFFQKVWEKVAVEHSAINEDKPAVVKLLDTGDHAVCWRFGYWVKNIYHVLDTEFTVNKHAYDLSLVEGIELSTPLTHQVNTYPDTA